MRKIGQGHKSEVFELPDGRILKLFVPEFASLAPTEAGFSAMLQHAGVVAPRADELVEIDGRPGIVFSGLRTGRTLSGEVRSRPWLILRAARKLAELHDELHACRSGELPSQRERITDEIESARCVPLASRRLALATLEQLPDDDRVCHNDIHMLNVIVYDDGAALIDWMLATRGNPLGDVANALLQLRFGEQPKSLVARIALEGGRAIFWRTYLRRYLQLRPGVAAELARWELPVATGLAGRREGRMQRQLLQRVETLVRVSGGKPSSSGSG